MEKLSWPKRIFLVLAALAYAGAGTLHFTHEDMYLKMMPPYVPWHHAMVLISGICEILGGVGLLIPATRRIAAWGLVALLIAVFPANLYMATNPAEAGAQAIPAMARWIRLPMQAVLIFWVVWSAGLTISPDRKDRDFSQ